MNEERRVFINPVVAIIIVLQLLFVVVAIVSIRQLLEPEEPELQVNLTGLNQNISGLPENQKEPIEFYINSALSNNNPGRVVLKNGINIREGSVISKYYENADMHYINFIVDIPDFEQSYKVARVWVNDANNEYVSPNVNTAVTCLDAEEMVYPEFNCKNDNMYSAQTVLASVLRAVRAQAERDGGLSMDFEYVNETGESRIRVSRWSCDTMCFCKKYSEEGKKQLVTEFGEFLDELGYSLNQIPYYIYNCEDETRALNENDEIVLQE